MKKYIFRILLAIGVFYASIVAAKHFWRGEIMATAKVCERWGDHPLDAAKFKNGSEPARASMACSLLKNQNQFIGKSAMEIRQLLGDPDGFYFIDAFPAYLVSGGGADFQDSWQLVFMLGQKRKVTEIFAHKNCCDRSAIDKRAE